MQSQCLEWVGEDQGLGTGEQLHWRAALLKAHQASAFLNWEGMVSHTCRCTWSWISTPSFRRHLGKAAAGTARGGTGSVAAPLAKAQPRVLPESSCQRLKLWRGQRNLQAGIGAEGSKDLGAFEDLGLNCFQVQVWAPMPVLHLQNISPGGIILLETCRTWMQSPTGSFAEWEAWNPCWALVGTGFGCSLQTGLLPNHTVAKSLLCWGLPPTRVVLTPFLHRAWQDYLNQGKGFCHVLWKKLHCS